MENKVHLYCYCTAASSCIIFSTPGQPLMALTPIAAPTLVETMKLRMYEMGLTQSKLAEMLGLSAARMSEIITGKGEPSLKTGREISRKLNIDPAIVLGV